MYKLSKHEELILAAIWRLAGNAYIVTLRKHFDKITGKSINGGSLCNTLASLVRKGLIKSQESKPVSRQGGRRKVLYFLTIEGKRALNHANKIQKLVWEGFSEFIT